ncbi:MAG TPA: hypothetical protein EYQ50_14905 [Verrucomicrobiales bacterium]|nr:hypothetical protein [Verrucomicrobiales bacterium]
MASFYTPDDRAPFIMKQEFLLIWTILLLILNPNEFFGQSSGLEGKRSYRFQRSFIQLPTSMYGGFTRDRYGFFWICSTGKGAYRYDGHELKRYPDGPESLSGTMISSILEDSDGDIWFTTFSNGVTRYLRSTGKFVYYRYSSDSLPCLYDDGNGFLWITTYGGGLNRFDKSSERFERFRHDPEISGSVVSDALCEVMADRHGKIWVTGKGGLGWFDPEKGLFHNFPSNAKRPAKILSSLLEDGKERSG